MSDKKIIKHVMFTQRETDKAQLFKFQKNKKWAWLPKTGFKILDFKIDKRTKKEIYKIEIENWVGENITYLKNSIT